MPAGIRQEEAEEATIEAIGLHLNGLDDDSLSALLTAACRMRHLEGLPSPD